MSRPRQKNKGLTNSRIYPKGKRYYLYASESLINPEDGKAKKWHSLCPIKDGETEARRLAQIILDHNHRKGDEGDFPQAFRKYMGSVIAKRDSEKPTEPARVKIHETGNKQLLNYSTVIESGFHEFNVREVMPVDVADFLDQWEGRRMAEVYHSRLSDFFRWACRKGYRNDNPVREVSIEKVKRRMRYITDEEYHAIRDGLLFGKDGRINSSGQIVQCYVDLCYLLYQRTTEIRLLKWRDISEHGILFMPTKTEKSSGARVFVPMTPQVWQVLQNAKRAWPLNKYPSIAQSEYVICNKRGEPYTAHGIGTAWERGCKRAGVSNATLKDLRAKAMTDAKAIGYSLKQISIGAAHTDEAMTEAYIKLRETPVSEVQLQLPKEKKKAKTKETSA
ncbi:hypothetical protein C2134_02755 [Chromobacterium sinusclupearum]|uniref:Tyr recombinase domain-containing protein n=1 Tax=Chromobacterium sinusclupearum TaxID=2077146 RepID=A0A2K4MSX5_9NEIS|nr:tyrosine-type recombinase/integrase [Chromobacterium sinusclupearum]POB00128.1 hypothetical protein C2134_02755 [Chromobacterium sinusclupearum]